MRTSLWSSSPFLGTPFPGKKLSVGHQLEWIGLWTVFGDYSMGWSVGRTNWKLSVWDGLIADGQVVFRKLVEYLGRFSFACQVLAHLRPFLGPIGAWVCALLAVAYVVIPKHIVLVLEFMACEPRESSLEVGPIRLERDTADVFRANSSGEGNSFLITKLMTTSFPLNVILMEVAAQGHHRGLDLHLRWVPREQINEADDLSNSDFKRFKPENRLDVDLALLPFIVLEPLLKHGEAMYHELEGLTRVRLVPRLATSGGEGASQKGKRAKLSESEPW